MPIMCKNPLLMKVSEISFTMDELRLYLDTHPDCAEALAYMNEMQEQRNLAVMEYEAQYGPLTSYGNVNTCSWQWDNGPWPWQN